MGRFFGRSGIRLQQRHRRRALMFWLTLALLSLWFAGSSFLKTHLASEPVAFLLYWTAVTALAVATILLAGYDMLRVPRELRQEHRLPKSPR